MPACAAGPCSTSMNSGSSSDSMVSINSGFSDDSMEHLSAEERACLMFLEETIESLETEDDSGLSTDEPSWPPHMLDTGIGQLGSASPTKLDELTIHNDSSRVLGNNQRPHSLLVPTPLVFANGSAKFLKKTELGTLEQKTANEPNASAINSYHPSAKHSAIKPASSPQYPGIPKPTSEPPKQLAELPPSFIPEPPAKDGISIQPKAKESSPKIQLDPRPDHQHKIATPEMLMELIPPPSDFMDEPAQPHTHPKSQSQPQTLLQQPQSQPPPKNTEITPPPGFGKQVNDGKPLGIASASPGGLLSPGELDKLRKKASMKKTPEIAQKGSDQSGSPPSSPNICRATAEHGEPKSPPAVAPKPKKFPSSIIMKNHKDSGPSHSLVPTSDRTMNQQKVHIEALKKLGLLKGDEGDLSPAISPPQRVPTPVPVSTGISAALPAAEVVEAPGKTVLSLPSPHSEKGGRHSPIIPRGSNSRVFEFKSASLERSGMGHSQTVEQSSSIKGQEKTAEKATVELSPGQLRRNWSRPASTGSLKDLSIHQLPSDSNSEAKIRRSLQSCTLPANMQLGMDVQKPSRTHGISVVISPQSKNGEDRKQALRKLGLIRD